MKNRMKKMALMVSLSALALGLIATPGMTEQLKVDANLSDYVKVQGVAGNLNSVGSDTLNNLMTFWAESFRKHYPNVNIQIEGKGSSTAPPALIEGTSQLGPMSRKMKDKEVQAFEANALDYILKPIDEECLHQVLEKVRGSLSQKRAVKHKRLLLDLVSQISGEPISPMMIMEKIEEVASR